jgi:hypothetical protein
MYGGADVRLHVLLIWELYGDDFQLYTPAALLQGRAQMSVELQVGKGEGGVLDSVGKKRSVPLKEPEPDYPSVQVVALSLC